jgi:LacI family transcriptional regulator
MGLTRESTYDSFSIGASAMKALAIKIRLLSLATMQKRTRIEDVARHAAVSTATVSRALSEPHRVRPATLAKVQLAVQQLGYVPDAAGRALASGRTRTVGCVIPTLDHAIFASSTHAMQTALAAAGYQLLVASHEYNPVMEFTLVQALQERGVDALVLVGGEHHAPLWRAVADWGKPALLTWACDPRLPSVGFDNEAIAALATRHLLDLGHRRIAMITGHTVSNDRARARVAGFLATLAAAGVAKGRVAEQALTLAGGRLGLTALLQSKKPPTAIVCGNDLLAAGALLQAQRMGLKVPGDLSICGIDNHDLAAETNPSLTTVSLPTRQLGQIAAAQILAALDGKPIAQRSLLPFELKVRGTTGSVASKGQLGMPGAH